MDPQWLRHLEASWKRKIRPHPSSKRKEGQLFWTIVNHYVLHVVFLFIFSNSVFLSFGLFIQRCVGVKLVILLILTQISYINLPIYVLDWISISQFFSYRSIPLLSPVTISFAWTVHHHSILSCLFSLIISLFPIYIYLLCKDYENKISIKIRIWIFHSVRDYYLE